MRTAEAVSLLFILFCRDPQFRWALYKLDPVLFRRFTNGGGVAVNVDDMTDEEFIDYCRNGGELSGLITERHPKCDWCGGMCRVGKDGMCRNCRVRERRRTDPEYAQHLRDLANQRNARNREKRNEYARRHRSEHLAQARASARKYAAAHQREMAEYHRRWRSEHPEKYAQYEAKRKRKRQLAKEAVNE